MFLLLVTLTKKMLSVYIQSLADLNYFRIKSKFDQSGVKTTFKLLQSLSCDNLNSGIAIANDGTKEVGIILNSSTDQILELQVHNTLGQIGGNSFYKCC